MAPKRRTKNAVMTVMCDKTAKILVKKYSRLENVKGDHLDIDYEKITMEKPANLTNDDWLIVTLVDFLHRVELLYSSCSLFCTSDTCPMFNAGPHYKYFWDDSDSPTPIQVSAPEYFSYLKRFIKRNLQDPNIIPGKSGEKLNEDALSTLKMCYRRLFRILAHLYVCHFQNISSIQEPNVVEIMNTILTHYTKFALAQGMIDLPDLEMLSPVFAAINKDSGNPLCPVYENVKSQ
ncbi:MOB kinase activator-like 1 A [Tritrichomonas foetus]|uniref:MOB kinase activator-like 1 A n=1 Tax=Tritrichomonas foetus TaxID=1144522 RepID=A0A1J4J5T4_9EUKA|nr:MOB kinase activator-like 1 A [Tritrichomonas foetus]|eukprot:OHS93511.1 MOB kinase activator-like 1 A [Tritrichomonas foetus]